MRPRRTRPLAAAVLMLPPGLRDDRRLESKEPETFGPHSSISGPLCLRMRRAWFRALSPIVVFDMFEAGAGRSITGTEECKMSDTGSGIRLPRSTSVNVSRRALMRSAAATLAATAVASIARPAFAQRGPARTLLKGGVVLSFDPAVGDFEKADVLIEDKKIIAVRPDISADATAIDASRMIVQPGFIDTHHHFYQSALRNVLANGVLADYFRDISGAATNHYRPEDAYIGNLTGALRSLDAGITTITDLSQVSNTPEHSDALIKGLAESGIRAIYAYSRGSGAGAKWPGDVERDRPAGDAGARHRGQQGAMAARAQVRPAHLYP